jgi:hypothetical protein
LYIDRESIRNRPLDLEHLAAIAGVVEAELDPPVGLELEHKPGDFRRERDASERGLGKVKRNK